MGCYQKLRLFHDRSCPCGNRRPKSILHTMCLKNLQLRPTGEQTSPAPEGVCRFFNKKKAAGWSFPKINENDQMFV